MSITKKVVYWGVMILAVCLLCLRFPTGAQAVEFDQDGRIEKGEIIDDDLFMSGDRLVMDGVVKGDFYAAANTIVINGVVHGSVFLAAQTIELNGTVKGSLYGASQSIELEENAKIERNLFYAGFALQANAGSQVGKDALFTGYQAILDGSVGRDVLASIGALEVNGEVGRNVRVNVGDPEEGQPSSMPFSSAPGMPPMIPSGLRINESAKIGGTLTYSSVKEQSQGIKSKPQGEVIYKPIEAADNRARTAQARQSLPYLVGKYVLNRIQEIVTLFVIGLLALWLLPSRIEEWKQRMKAEPLASGLNGFLTVLIGYVGAGLMALVVLAIGIFLGVITLGGLSQTVFGLGFSSLGLALAVFSLIVAYVSKILVSLWIGEIVINRFVPQSGHKVVLVLIVGVIIYVLLRSIPILGWVLGVVATLVGVGAIYLVLRDQFRPPAKAVSIEVTLS